MFALPQKFALRRMNLEEIVAKLEQIEQQAQLTLQEFPRGPTLERQRLIAAIARQVKGHLKDQLRHGERTSQHENGEAQRPLQPVGGSAS